MMNGAKPLSNPMPTYTSGSSSSGNIWKSIRIWQNLYIVLSITMNDSWKIFRGNAVTMTIWFKVGCMDLQHSERVTSVVGVPSTHLVVRHYDALRCHIALYRIGLFCGYRCFDIFRPDNNFHNVNGASWCIQCWHMYTTSDIWICLWNTMKYFTYDKSMLNNKITNVLSNCNFLPADILFEILRIAGNAYTCKLIPIIQIVTKDTVW